MKKAKCKECTRVAIRENVLNNCFPKDYSGRDGVCLTVVEEPPGLMEEFAAAILDGRLDLGKPWREK